MVQKLISQTTKQVGEPPRHIHDEERLRQVCNRWRISRQPPVEEENNNTVDDIS